MICLKINFLFFIINLLTHFNMFKLFFKKILLFRLTFLKKINKNFYSQFGEDKILNELIPNNFTNGLYVDVGCFHPKKYSNTYMLFRRGWRGINIDMEKNKIASFNLARPNDYNFLGAISDKIEKVKIYRNQKFGVSSTINEKFIKNEDIIDVYYIQTTTLNSVLENSPFKEKKIDLIIKSEIYLFLINRKYILKSWNFYSLIFIKENYYENN